MEQVTIPELQRMKKEKKRIVMMTAYDFQMSRILDRAGVDIMLVGDSGGRSLLGYEDANRVTMDEMVIMTRSVSRGTKRALVVADMPFMSFQVNKEEAIRNAGRLVREGGAQAVKLEVGEAYFSTVRAVVAAGVPVMAHIGITPMGTIGAGGFRAEGVEISEDQVLKDARAMDEAGAFALFLARVPPALAKAMTERLRIPTISGSASSAECDGQFGFTHAVVGFSAEALDRPPGHYGSVGISLYDAARKFAEDARAGKQAAAGEGQRRARD
jgi:3-methyl-2-oxobutanoate hydroxymethyltransferase